MIYIQTCVNHIFLKGTNIKKNLEKNNTQLSEEELQSILSSYGENRFRDNDELKYFRFFFVI